MVSADFDFQRTPAGPDRSAGAGLDAFGRDVAAVFGSLWRRKLWIAGTVAVALGAAFLFVLLSTPLYLSTTRLLIDPRPKRILESEVVPSGLGSSSSGADSLLVDSQVEIVGSDAVLRRVIEAKHLAADPEFLVGGGPGLTTRLRALLGQEARSAEPTEIALDRLRRLSRIARVGNTYVIEIGIFSRDAEKAASIANAIAAAYLTEQANASTSATRETTESLTGRLKALRQDVAAAEDRVEDYRRKNSLVGTQGVLIDEQQLQDLNGRLGAARLQREAAEARFAQSARLAQAGGGSAASSEALDSPVIAGLRTSLAEYERSLANLGERLGPRHPQVRSLEAQKATVKAQLDSEVRLAVERARSALDLARKNEAGLTASLNGLKQKALTNNEAQIRLRALQRDAEASRALLETVLSRAKQSGEQEALPSTNVRVLAAAVAPFRVSYPPAPIVLAAALALGLVLGCLIAWFRDRFA
ncbi:GumC family protein [Prosthecodimorpha staleyi]|uniref:GumC family protein n=1 Tax=Prosthecodimorpha staleyi TaxID=2840188 RepID=A0A947D8X5_9HYPH|nr:GumC family protein [Prosthecodimorpha staleyi]MBT9292239.1 GumC family protein [Prosthecodimorpha staleyi]